jgi:hypothetical protein
VERLKKEASSLVRIFIPSSQEELTFEVDKSCLIGQSKSQVFYTTWS